MKLSLREKSAPFQGSVEVDATGATREGALTVRGRDLGGVGGGRSDEKEGREGEEGNVLEDAAGGGRQNDPAEDEGVIAQDVASEKGELGRDGDDPHDDEGEDGHSPMSSRSAQGSIVRGRASAAAATSCMLKGLPSCAAGTGEGMGASNAAGEREQEGIMPGRGRWKEDEEEEEEAKEGALGWWWRGGGRARM